MIARQSAGSGPSARVLATSSPPAARLEPHHAFALGAEAARPSREQTLAHVGRVVRAEPERARVAHEAHGHALSEPDPPGLVAAVV